MLELSSEKRIILQPKNEKKNWNKNTKLNKAKNINKEKQNQNKTTKLLNELIFF